MAAHRWSPFCLNDWTCTRCTRLDLGWTVMLIARKGTIELTWGACYVPGVQVTLNGETRELPDGLTVAGLLGELGLRERRIAVEINREVIPRDEYGRSIREGDEIEIVHFVGGG